MNNTSLTYVGNVKIETTHRKYLHKNSGTCHLFSLFSNVLAKKPVDKLSLPTYLMLYDLSSKSVEEIEDFKTRAMHEDSLKALKYFVDLNSYTVTESNNFETEFTALLTASMIMDLKEKQQLYSLHLAIVAGDQNSLLAIVNFDHEIFKTLQSGGQAVVRWRMSLTNAEDEQQPVVLSL